MANELKETSGVRTGFCSPWMSTGQAAKYLGASPKTLAVWRCQGKGPRYHIVNERLVRYHVNDLDAHVLGQPGGGGSNAGI